MKVLVACEFSGIVRDAFAVRGHDAWSCDLLPSERPGQHIQGNVLDVLGDGWDLMIAHPPCTYLSRAGARWMYKGGRIDPTRRQLGMEAREFFIKLWTAFAIPRVAIENPTPLKMFLLPAYTQAIQPYQFGHPYSKRTLLWLRGLPPLQSTNVVVEHTPWVRSNSGAGRRAGQQWHSGKCSGGTKAERTFEGIATAMADQWG
jgi:hypothetical protein